MNRRNLLLWVGLVALFVFGAQIFFSNISQESKVDYSSFLQDVGNNQISSVVIESHTIKISRKDGSSYTTVRPQANDLDLVNDLLSHHVKIEGVEPAKPSLLLNILVSLLPVLIIVGALFYFYRQQSGGGKGNPFSFGQSKAKKLSSDQIETTFDDVAGAESAKEELIEVVDFLRSPQKFTEIGGTIPKGVLLSGPPGTGKTLIARAVAGEAKVPFFFISGSDFVEMFVGVGASRVRDMFAQARKSAPCIIFIDEIDAVGRRRGAGYGGGNDEREQTLNQLLVEMDGFDAKSGIIIIAATNRADVLDPALLRPGRFDRQVHVDLPDLKGREAILKVHAKKVKLSPIANLFDVARGTVGFSGADLANLINESALLAARVGKKEVDTLSLEQAKDKIMMGAERSSDFMSDEEKSLTAYHEAGHAIVGYLSPSHDEVYKMTIIPRGRALGVTMFLPEQDKKSYTKEYLLSRLATAFGGRIAEELIFGKEKITTGASNDIQQATSLARNMVTRWGFSDAVGPLDYAQGNDEPFLGRSLGQGGNAQQAEETLKRIDNEIRGLVNSSYKSAKEILTTNIDKLHTMAKVLLERETVGKEEISSIMKGKELPPFHPKEPLPNPQKEVTKNDAEETQSIGTTDENT